MRVLIIVHGYPPKHNGGAERRAERTARTLAARGHEVRVLCVETTYATHSEVRWSEHLQDGVMVQRISYNPIRGRIPWRWSYDSPQLAAPLDGLITRWRPDVAHLFSGYLMTGRAIDVVVNAGLPIVVSLTDYFWICHRLTLVRSDGSRCSGPEPVVCARCLAEDQRRFQYLKQYLPTNADQLWQLAGREQTIGSLLGVNEQKQRALTLHRALRQATILIAPSQYLANTYAENGIDITRMHIWRQGVDLQLCPLRRHDDTIRVGYIGQIKPHKGVHLLIDAWSRLRGSRPRRLELYGSDAGDKTYGDLIRSEVARLTGVMWRGEFQGADIWNVLANLDAVVVPSRWVENSPNIILEAQAMGVPVIGSDLGGVAELISHGINGLVFKPDNVDDLAQQLQRLLDEPELLEVLRAEPLPFKSLDDEITQIESLYTTLVDESTAQLVKAEAKLCVSE